MSEEPNPFDRHSPQTREWLANYALDYKDKHGFFPPVHHARALLLQRESIPEWMRSVIEEARDTSLPASPSASEKEESKF